MNVQLSMLGVDYRQASLAVREQLSFTPAEQSALLARIASLPGVSEALLLATCNRTELYLAGPYHDTAALLGAFATFRPQAASACAESFHHCLYGEEAALHLFHVASGIDSQILGDTNVAAQVKQAHRIAAESGTLGPILDRTVTESLRAAKRARRETAIGRGSASVGAAVLRSIRSRCEALPLARIMVLGGGAAGQEISRHIAKARPASLQFSSRNPEQASEFAKVFRGEVLPWSSLPDSLATVDVVVAATSARLSFLTPEALSGILQRRLLIIDAGVPRNADSACGTLKNVELVDLDHLESEQSTALAARRRELPQVEALLGEEIARWRRWWWARYGTPVVQSPQEASCPQQW